VAGETKKLVSRKECAADPRYQDIALTAAGHRLVPVLAAMADRDDEEFFSTLSCKEREALVATLKKLVQTHGLRKIQSSKKDRYEYRCDA
jgi:DNA-binding MarR family transcriptional regulator